MDIREILAALSPEDRQLWSQHRTEMRRSYLNAHNTILGMAAWDHMDDAFVDMIDIKLAILFDRSGRFEATKEIIGADDIAKTAQELLNREILMNNNPSIASKATAAIMNGNGWKS